MSSKLPILYIKSACPWCIDVVEFLWKNGITYLEKNVSQDRAAFTEMEKKSGQTKAPVLDWHGQILADFGVEELKPFLRQHKVSFKDV